MFILHISGAERPTWILHAMCHGWQCLDGLFAQCATTVVMNTTTSVIVVVVLVLVLVLVVVAVIAALRHGPIFF